MDALLVGCDNNTSITGSGPVVSDVYSDTIDGWWVDGCGGNAWDDRFQANGREPDGDAPGDSFKFQEDENLGWCIIERNNVEEKRSTSGAVHPQKDENNVLFVTFWCGNQDRALAGWVFDGRMEGG